MTEPIEASRYYEGYSPRRWRCARCGVEVRFASSSAEPPDLPGGWARRDGGELLDCLGCRRDRVVAAAGDEARRRGLSRGEVQAAERDALIDLELERTPDAGATMIAKRIGVSSVSVKRRREAA